jgi:hypothetical protein
MRFAFPILMYLYFMSKFYFLIKLLHLFEVLATTPCDTD